MAGPRDELLFVADIRDAIERILTYTSLGRSAFFAQPMIQDAVIRNLEIMGEAVRGIGEEVRARHLEIPWRQIASVRDRVIHGYFRVDLEIIWDIVETELPALRGKIAALLPPTS